jgi:hypothetical protein
LPGVRDQTLSLFVLSSSAVTTSVSTGRPVIRHSAESDGEWGIDPDQVTSRIELKVEDVGVVGCSRRPDQHASQLSKAPVFFLVELQVRRVR